MPCHFSMLTIMALPRFLLFVNCHTFLGMMEWFPIVLFSLELRIFLLLEWFPLKARQLSLLCYLIYSQMENKSVCAFPNSICVKVNTPDMSRICQPNLRCVIGHVAEKFKDHCCCYIAELVVLPYQFPWRSRDQHTEVGLFLPLDENEISHLFTRETYFFLV